MAEKELEEPCSFRVLRINVTDDVAAIDAAFQKQIARTRTLEHSPQPPLRQKYKDVVAAGSLLVSKDQEAKRREIIEFHTDGFAKYVSNFVSGRQGDITQENRDFLVAEGQKPAYHLCPELAKRIVGEVLVKHDAKVREPLKPAVPPAPVLNLKISGDQGYPHLTWKQPGQGCDSIRIWAKCDAFPAKEGDGREVLHVGAEECLDEKAEPGKLCYYAVFSYSGDQTASVKERHFFASGVNNLRIEGLPEKIEIVWDAPKFEYHEVVIFRAPVGSLGIDRKPGQFPAAKPGTVSRSAGKAGRFVDDRSTGGIEAGVLYEYVIVVDYGMVGSKREFSSDQIVSCSALPSAKPVQELVLHSTADGIRLSWKRPADLCDKAVVVRNGDRYPEDEQDGVQIAQDGPDTCLDKGLLPGKTYHYAVFSVYRSHASASLRALKLYAGPATSFNTTNPVENPGSIGLTWALPPGSQGVKLFRRKGTKPETKESAGALQIAAGEERAVPSSAAGRFLEAVEIGVTYHYHLHVLYPDGQWSPAVATSGEAFEPAVRAGAPALSVTSAGEVDVSWAAPDFRKAKSYRYRVWRRQADSLAGRTPCLLNETGDTSFRDSANADSQASAPVPGQTYEYAIESVVGPVHGPVGEWKNVFVTRDARLTSAVGSHGTVVLEWSAPPNAKRMDVKRKTGDVTVPSELSRATDRGLNDGTTYEYLITAVFGGPAGEEFRSQGIPASATPVVPAEALRNLSVSYEASAVRVSWLPPSSRLDGIIVARVEGGAPVPRVGELFDVSRISAIARLAPADTSFHDNATAVGRTYHYGIYAVRASTATYSGSISAPLLAAVDSLTARNRGKEIWLQWEWPSGVETVRISRGNQPAKTFTRGQYRACGSVYIDSIPEQAARYRYVIRAITLECGSPVESLLFSEVQVIGGALPKVPYKVKVKKPFVEAVCDLRSVRSSPGGLELIRNTSHDPRSREDGSVVALANGYQPGKEVVLRDENPPARGYVYYRVFLSEPDSAKHMVTLANPPLSERKVEFR